MVSTSWFLFNCNQLDDGTSQLMPAPHLSCSDDAWRTARVYAILTLGLWGVLMPLVLALSLHLARSRLRTVEFSRKFSLITFGYKRQCVSWGTLLMLKKFVVSGCIVLFREYALVQCTLVLVTILAFICLAVGYRPFYNGLISNLSILGEVRMWPNLQQLVVSIESRAEACAPNRWYSPNCAGGRSPHSLYWHPACRSFFPTRLWTSPASTRSSGYALGLRCSSGSCLSTCRFS